MCGCWGNCSATRFARRRRSAVRAPSSAFAACRKRHEPAGQSEFDELSSLLARLPVESADAARARLRALPEPREHRRTTSPHSSSSCATCAKPDVAAAAGSCQETFARLVAGGIARRRTLRGGLQPADRAGAHGASHRGVAADAHSQVQPRSPRCSTQRDRVDLTVPRTRRGDRRAAAGDHLGVGDRRSPSRIVHRRSTKSAAA